MMLEGRHPGRPPQQRPVAGQLVMQVFNWTDSTEALEVLLGGPGGFSFDRSYQIADPSPGTTNFGFSMAAGDQNGDGHTDLVVGPSRRSAT